MAWLYTKIVKEYLTHTKLREDWNDLDWVGLVLLGYRAGAYMKGGVAGVVSWLERNKPDVVPTVTSVVGNAEDYFRRRRSPTTT